MRSNCIEMGGKFASPFVNNRRFSHTIAPCTQFRVRISDAVRMCSLFSEVMENKQEQKFDFFRAKQKIVQSFPTEKRPSYPGASVSLEIAFDRAREPATHGVIHRQCARCQNWISSMDCEWRIHAFSIALREQTHSLGQPPPRAPTRICIRIRRFVAAISIQRPYDAFAWKILAYNVTHIETK